MSHCWSIVSEMSSMGTKPIQEHERFLGFGPGQIHKKIINQKCERLEANKQRQLEYPNYHSLLMTIMDLMLNNLKIQKHCRVNTLTFLVLYKLPSKNDTRL
ncbi:hypothetical protein PR048_012177 [Dryococelus australis]|uniref:Uncharacterized protein n=1 Tax=Dryococelus australis TaxID=614101 RepID=A0ABQ9HNT1_9NEOP|nr:hypothetical protein PR048_012177 [Dryococelus australis]